VPPFYAQSAKDGGAVRRFVLPPLLATRTDEAADAFGVDVLWPIFAYARDRRSTSTRLAPFFFWRRDALGRGGHTVVPPLFWHIDDGTAAHWHLWPLAGYDVDRETGMERYSTAYPLFSVESGPAGFGVSLLWPIIHFSSFDEGTPEERSAFQLFPLVWFRHDARRDSFALMPLFYWEDGPWRDTVKVLWPFFSYESERDQRRGWNLLWKLAEHETRPDGADFRVLHRLIHAGHEGSERVVEVNPFFRVERDDAADRAYTSVLSVVFERERAGDRVEYRLFHFLRFGDSLDGGDRAEPPNERR